jgi:hypothetical protein
METDPPVLNLLALPEFSGDRSLDVEPGDSPNGREED